MTVKGFVGLVWGLIVIGPSFAAEIEIFPGDSFRDAVHGLEPGDTLLVHPGTYTHSNRIAVAVRGTFDRPVLIRGVDGEARPVIRLIESGHNALEVVGATYVTIRGLEITAPGMRAADGIHLKGEPSHITIEDNLIHDIAVGINYRSDMHHIVARGNEIYDTRDTGEGFYVGCHSGSCSVTNSIIERNYVHDTLNATQGDGIEIKKNSHSNIIRDNVVHSTRFPCILLYGSGGGDRNIVERNAVWDCGDSGIQVAADVIVRNNIIVALAAVGFRSQPHNGVEPDNLDIVNNTIIGDRRCLRLKGWKNKPGVVFANNAVYCADYGPAIRTPPGITAAGNVFYPAPRRVPAEGFRPGRSKGRDFVAHERLEFYPTRDSALLAAAAAAYAPVDDFNGTPRSGPIDAGAYEWTGARNPGWRIGAGFRDAPARFGHP